MSTDRVGELKFDVIEMGMDGKFIRVIATDKTERNAEAVVAMAVMRRGVEESFFTTAPAGAYRESLEAESD